MAGRRNAAAGSGANPGGGPTGPPSIVCVGWREECAVSGSSTAKPLPLSILEGKPEMEDAEGGSGVGIPIVDTGG